MGYSNILTLTGLPGSGKTTVGALLAQSLGYNFLDLDQYISEKHNISIEKIFSSLGEATFRKYEFEALEQLINSQKNNLVLSLGGGSICSRTTLDLCLNKTKIIWINTDLNVIIKWFMLNGVANRPLLKNTNVYQKLLELYKKRLSFYEKAHLKIDINEQNSKNINHIIKLIIKNLKVYGMY